MIPESFLEKTKSEMEKTQNFEEDRLKYYIIFKLITGLVKIQSVSNSVHLFN